LRLSQHKRRIRLCAGINLLPFSFCNGRFSLFQIELDLCFGNLCFGLLNSKRKILRLYLK
jgi:hypothetical protein